jgi:hypothetical protein
LIKVAPRPVTPSRAGDYFCEEQVATWGVDSCWGLPHYPSTPYYRTFETAVNAEAHLFEFIVPMLPPSWNDAARVAQYATRLRSSDRPTAVAVASLDVCQPATFHASDYFAHWGLTHFLLDGHHKLQAAAESGTAVRLLSLLSLDGSLATRAEIMQLGDLRNRRPKTRPAAAAATTRAGP